MEIRLATRDDLPRLAEIYDAARAFMRRCGNTVQWVGGYPSPELVVEGIDAGEQYVCVLEGCEEREGCGGKGGERVVATFWFAVRPEPTYTEIFGGQDWLPPSAFRRQPAADQPAPVDEPRIFDARFAVRPEPTYAEIFDGDVKCGRGAWLDGDASFDDAPYGVVHRLASDGSVGGVGAFCLEWCLERCGNIRVDTHSSNAVMQALLEHLGYTRCGVIFIADGTPRDAFQKRWPVCK